MDVSDNRIIVRDGFEYKPIIEISKVHSKSIGCNCCKANGVPIHVMNIGCDKYSVAINICDECMIVLHDIISEYLNV